MRTKIHECYEGLYVLEEEEGAECIITTKEDKEKNVPLAIVAEIIDYYDLDRRERNNPYRYGVHFSITATEFHPEYLRNALSSSGMDMTEYDEDQRRLINIEFVYGYGGGVNVELEGIKSPGEDWNGIDSAIEHGRFGDYRRFKDHDDAVKYIRQVAIHQVSGIFGMIGFFLDRRVNRLGSNGWDVIIQQVENIDFTKRVMDEWQAKKTA